MEHNNIDVPEIYNLEAEQSVLGSLLIDPEAVRRVRGILRAEDFYGPQHQAIFRAICTSDDEDVRPDPITTIDWLLREGNLFDNAGARKYLLDIARATPSTANVLSYAHIVANAACKRRAVEAASKFLEKSYGATPGELQSQAEEIVRCFDGTGENDKGNPFAEFRETVGTKRPRIMSGYGFLDRMTGGFRIPGLTYIGAVPSAGKTAFAMNIALRHIQHNPDDLVAFFSLEMSTEMILERAVSCLEQINYQCFSAQSLRPEEAQKARDVSSYLEKHMLLRDDVRSIEEQAAIVTSKKPRLVIIDYIQKVHTSATDENRRLEIERISGEYKHMALRNNCHVMAISALKRSDRQSRPAMSDMRESSALEFDGDYILLLHRPYVYDKEKGNPTQAELIIDKCRFGSTGSVPLYFQGEYQRFLEVENGAIVAPPSRGGHEQIRLLEHVDFDEIATDDGPF